MQRSEPVQWLEHPTPSKGLLDVVIFANRVSLGLYFFFAGYSKVFVGRGLSVWYHDVFLPIAPSWVPGWFALIYGNAVPYAEIVLGGMLVLGIVTRVVALLLGLMLVSFTAALVNAYGLSGGGPVVFHYNIILITLAFLLVETGSGIISIDALVYSMFTRPNRPEVLVGPPTPQPTAVPPPGISSAPVDVGAPSRM